MNRFLSAALFFLLASPALAAPTSPTTAYKLGEKAEDPTAMYLADPRFTKTYEDVRPGLVQYLHDAILANAARHAR